MPVTLILQDGSHIEPDRSTETFGEWQAMAGAPLDGRPVLLCGRGVQAEIICVGRWNRYRLRWDSELGGAPMRPSHWMPLPPLPRS